MNRAGDDEGGPGEESLRTEVAALESKIRSHVFLEGLWLRNHEFLPV